MTLQRRVCLVLLSCVILAWASAEATARWVFDDPVKLPSPIGFPSAFDASPSITGDGLELYFISDRNFGRFETWVANRSNVTEDFGAPILSVSDNHAAVSDDGLSLFTNEGTPNDRNDLFVWERSDTASPWTNRTSVGAGVNSPDEERWADISSDGLELYFTRNTASDILPYEIWVSTRTDSLSAFGPATKLPDNINGDGADSPAISADGLHLFFVATDRPGGFGNSDIWVSSRTDISSPWGEPVNLGPTINTADSEWSPELAADGETLFFAGGTVSISLVAATSGRPVLYRSHRASF